MCQDCVTQRGSVKVPQVTGSLLFLVILCCCVVLCCRSPCVFLHVPRSYCKSLIKYVGGVTDNKRMVSADYIVRTMASGDRRHETD